MTDYTSEKDDVEAEKMIVKSSVDQELAKLKAERDKRQKKITHPEETEPEEDVKQQEQEKEVQTAS